MQFIILPNLKFVIICCYPYCHPLLYFCLIIQQMRVTEVVRFLSTLLRSLILVSLIILSFGWSYSHLLLQVNSETFFKYYILITYWYMLVICVLPSSFIGIKITKGNKLFGLYFFNVMSNYFNGVDISNNRNKNEQCRLHCVVYLIL